MTTDAANSGLPWESDYSTALAKAKANKQPILLLYTHGSTDKKIYNDRWLSVDPISSTLKGFVLVRIRLEDHALEVKYDIKKSATSVLFIDSASERVIAEYDGPMSARSLIKKIIEARKGAGLPITQPMNTFLKDAFSVDWNYVAEICESGDFLGLLSYIKPIEKDDSRERNYVALRIHHPASLSSADIACWVTSRGMSMRKWALPASGVGLAEVDRDSGRVAMVRINAPGCMSIQDDLHFDPNVALLSREYTLTAQTPQQNTTKQNYSSDRNLLLILSTNPTSPCTLKLGDRMTISIQYNNPGPNGVYIWARPYTTEISLSGFVASGSAIIQKGGGKTGQGFHFKAPAEVDEVRAEMVDSVTGEVVAIAILPVHATWK